MTIANPGAISDVADGGPIASDWGNAIRDRVVNNYATAAARDLAIPSPVVGQLCVIDNLTTIALGLQQYVGATDGWQMPWNLPWGVVDFVSTTTSQTGVGTAATDVTSITSTKTYVANRRLRVTFHAQIAKTTSADVLVNLTDTAGTVIQRLYRKSMLNGDVDTINAIACFTSTAGSQVIKVRANAVSSGTMDFTGATGVPITMLIEDIGPSGAPA